MENPFVHKTDQEEYERSIRRIPPKDPNQFIFERPTSGEIVALWWTTKYGVSDERYIPKYFKKVYRIDMPKQRKMFIKAGVLKVENDKYFLTPNGQELLSKYTEIISDHINSAGDAFNIKRKKIADISLY